MAGHKDSRSLRRKLLENYGWTSFGAVVKRVRVEKGLTLQAMADKVGSHKGYVSGIENGKVNPPAAKMVERFSIALGLDPNVLLTIAWAEKAPIQILEQAIKIVQQRLGGERRVASR